jgi:hypothetical protein
MLSKNPICRKRREGYFGESSKSKIWVFIQVMFGFNNVKFAEKQINVFRCSNLIFIYSEGFPTKDEVRFPRTPVIIASIFFEQYHEASRRTAQSRWVLLLEVYIISLLKYPTSRSHEFGIQ